MALLFSASGEGNSNLGLFNSSAAVFILLTVLLGNEGFYSEEHTTPESEAEPIIDLLDEQDFSALSSQPRGIEEDFPLISDE